MGKERHEVRAVCYGPFRNPPSGSRLTQDLEAIRSVGANTLRLYEVPSLEFMDALAAHGLRAIISHPWAQHTAFLDNVKTVTDIRHGIQFAARNLAGHPALFAHLVGNEIPSDIVRWLGPARVERFLDELMLSIKEIDPEALVSYATFPPTEYLMPPESDFVTVNVYLHEREVFRKYAARLQTLAGEKPLLFGEFGMDTVRHTLDEQARLIEWHLDEVQRCGAAGTTLFSWTDEWFKGDKEVEDWAFGLTTRTREPKPVLEIVRKTWTLEQTRATHPKASVVVCAYNAAATLRACLDSLDLLDYPGAEFILVDDGSTDSTAAIVESFVSARSKSAPLPFRYLRIPHAGLSIARNAGIEAATGEIVALTDADCIAEPDWLKRLVRTLIEGDYAAAGGPNLAPPARNWQEACVAAAPGAPTQVLFNDLEAEHVPGCNMAFWKSALLEIGGFDSVFTRAGDDVDVCWRLLDSGKRIGFSPSAMVWHHRRCTFHTFLRQQIGYGDAEAMLRLKHPLRFARWGGIRWGGAIYGASGREQLSDRDQIDHGPFGLGMFQAVYRKVHTAPIRLEERWDGVFSRAVVRTLGFVQPWVRVWSVWLGWLQHGRGRKVVAPTVLSKPVPDSGGDMEFWNEQGKGRLVLLEKLVHQLEERGWWVASRAAEPWDLQAQKNWFSKASYLTTDEWHGEGKVLVRVRVRGGNEARRAVRDMLEAEESASGRFTQNEPDAPTSD